MPRPARARRRDRAGPRRARRSASACRPCPTCSRSAPRSRRSRPRAARRAPARLRRPRWCRRRTAPPPRARRRTRRARAAPRPRCPGTRPRRAPPRRPRRASGSGRDSPCRPRARSASPVVAHPLLPHDVRERGRTPRRRAAARRRARPRAPRAACAAPARRARRAAPRAPPPAAHLRDRGRPSPTTASAGAGSGGSHRPPRRRTAGHARGPSSASSSCSAVARRSMKPPRRDIPRSRCSCSTVTCVPPSAVARARSVVTERLQHLRERRALDLLLPGVCLPLARVQAAVVGPHVLARTSSRAPSSTGCPLPALALVDVLDARHLRPPARQVVRVGRPCARPPPARRRSRGCAWPCGTRDALVDQPPQVLHEQQVLELRDDRGQALERLDRLAPAVLVAGAQRRAEDLLEQRGLAVGAGAEARAGCGPPRRSGSARRRARTISRSMSSKPALAAAPGGPAPGRTPRTRAPAARRRPLYSSTSSRSCPTRWPAASARAGVARRSLRVPVCALSSSARPVGELLADHAQRQELVALQPQDRAQPVDVRLASRAGSRPGCAAARAASGPRGSGSSRSRCRGTRGPSSLQTAPIVSDLRVRRRHPVRRRSRPEPVSGAAPGRAGSASIYRSR